jgi:hypothetical protein
MPETETIENSAVNEAPIEETSGSEAHVEERSGEEPTDTKERNRAGYERRLLEKQLEALRRENEGYKRRADEERKAKLTEEQRIKEERDQLQAEVDRLRVERMQAQVAAEFRLPTTLAARLIGTDEEAMRADASEGPGGPGDQPRRRHTTGPGLQTQRTGPRRQTGP